jgi:hypothetical protein
MKLSEIIIQIGDVFDEKLEPLNQLMMLNSFGMRLFMQ